MPFLTLQLEEEAQAVAEAEAAEDAAAEVHSAEQAAEVESLADEEVRVLSFGFSFVSFFLSCSRARARASTLFSLTLPALSRTHPSPSLSPSKPFNDAGCFRSRGSRGQGNRGRVQRGALRRNFPLFFLFSWFFSRVFG